MDKVVDDSPYRGLKPGTPLQLLEIYCNRDDYKRKVQFFSRSTLSFADMDKNR